MARHPAARAARRGRGLPQRPCGPQDAGRGSSPQRGRRVRVASRSRTADKANLSAARRSRGSGPRGATRSTTTLNAAITCIRRASAARTSCKFTDGRGQTQSWQGEATSARSRSVRTALVHVVGLGVPWGARLRRASPCCHRAALLRTRLRSGRLQRDPAEAAGGRYWQADSPDRLRGPSARSPTRWAHRYVLRLTSPRGDAREGSRHRIGR
jgi:hypothetical protein